MSLIKSASKKAVGKNIKAEESSGKSPKQSIAIALNVQRRNKRKKMADGGTISAASEKRPMPEDKHLDAHAIASADAAHSPEEDFVTEERASIDLKLSPRERAMIERHRMAQGGSVSESFVDEARPSIHDTYADQRDIDDQDSFSSRVPFALDDGETDVDSQDMIGTIMAKRKKMADGGMVDLDSNEEEQPNSYYQRNEDAALKENYDSDMDDVSQSDDSSLGDELEDEDSHDMVDKIRKSIKSKRS